MKSSEILRLAAEDVFKCWGFGCISISNVIRRFPKDIVRQNLEEHDRRVLSYFNMFKPLEEKTYLGGSWWGSCFDLCLDWQLPKNMNARILALCLAADIAESEGD
jgi:hypothetical protein